MSTWLHKIATQLSQSRFLQEMKRRGWTKEQLKKDQLIVWQLNNKFFFSLGDWAKVKPKDVEAALKYTNPGITVDWDYECGGPGGKGWTSVF